MYNIENINSIAIVDFITYLRTEKVCKRLLYRVGFLLMRKRCSSCRRYVDMSSFIEKKIYFARNTAIKKIYPRSGTILYNSKLSYRTFLLFMHCYYYDNCALNIFLTFIDINRITVLIFKSVIERIICRKYDAKTEKLGGKGKVLEIDKRLIAKRKYNKGRMVGQVWVFKMAK
ncbi:hypothetical protein DMUE_1113 [Dictyocoela muelleri]|nr:hypothetical protein DMUE_1113 [Dictyocoela muelleri]